MSSPDEARLNEIEEKIKRLLNDKFTLINELQQRANRKRELSVDRSEIYEKLGRKKSSFDKNKVKMRNFSEMLTRSSSKRRGILENITLVKKQLSYLEIGVPRDSGGTLRDKIQDIEWKLETEKLSRGQENSLIDEVRSLELALQKWSKTQAVRQKFDELQISLKELEKKMTEAVVLRESLGTHLDLEREEMEKMIRLREQLRAENRLATSEIGELELNLELARQEIHTLSMTREEILECHRADLLQKDRENEERLIKQAKTSAKEKLSKGSKLSIDELKLALHDELGEA